MPSVGQDDSDSYGGGMDHRTENYSSGDSCAAVEKASLIVTQQKADAKKRITLDLINSGESKTAVRESGCS